MAKKRSGEVDYVELARRKIHRPSEVKRKPKILVYSRNKKGKSTFCASAPNVLIADPEAGTDEMKTIDPHVWPILDWGDMQGFYGFARTGEPCPKCPDPHPIDWFAIDGLTRVANMALNYVMKVEEERNLDRQPGFVQQRDYGKAGELVKQMLINFHALPQGVIYTAQERMLVEGEFADEDEDVENPSAQFVPDLPKGVRSMSNSIVDVIGRLYVVRIDKDGETKPQRRLWIGPSDAYDTGVRSDFDLPPVLKNPTVPRLTRLIRTGSPVPKKK